MKQKEKLLFKELCKFQNNDFDESLIPYANANVLGQIFFNRMQGIAYGALKKHDLLGKVNREFKSSLQSTYEYNREKNKSFFKCVKFLSDILLDCKTVMLKGAFLCAYYPEGYRTSNDIDLLVMPEDIGKISDVLLKAGFRQGNIRNGEFVPAARKEIIESKMMRGETVPYIKEVNLPHMRFLEVDINFSLDYKNGNADILSSMLERSSFTKVGKIKIPTLDKTDFFIHLCSHLYKEATTLPWIEMRRDMTLYKYCDIYLLLGGMTDFDFETLQERAKELGMEKICAYAIYETAELFDIFDSKIVEESKKVLEDDKNFLRRVISPKDKKVFLYKTDDITKRFFMENRKKDLTEVKKT